VSTRPIAAATDPAAEEGAAEAFEAGGNAVDAVIAGFLAAGGARPGVLLAPLAALVAGVGEGARCIDGRPVQPGRGAQRPRGFREGEAIPAAARAAAPRSLGALALLHASGASKALSTLARPAVARAKKADARSRASVIQAFVRHGAALWRLGEMSRPVVHAGGATAGGVLTEADLAAPPADEPATFVKTPGGELLLPPWPAPAEARRAHAVVAADPRGGVAALAFAPDEHGVEVPELELLLPGDAEPVRRGVPRVSPGTVRPAALPIAILRRPAEGWYAAVGAALASGLEPGTDVSLAGWLDDLARGGCAVGVSVQRRRTQLHRAEGRA
jgi:gamma-glutamyltranspeptidase/glutathione hydrolase